MFTDYTLLFSMAYLFLHENDWEAQTTNNVSSPFVTSSPFSALSSSFALNLYKKEREKKI